MIEQLAALLEHGITPFISAQGSVGASGDLAHLAHLSAVLIGEREAIVKGKHISGREALAACGLQPLVLGPKEGLALINGTQVSSALAFAGLTDAWICAKTALVSEAISTDAAMGPLLHYIHKTNCSGFYCTNQITLKMLVYPL